MPASSILAAILASTVVSPDGLDPRFTPAERECAATIGIKLGWGAANTTPLVRRLTWACPFVVRGTIVDLVTDLEGPYHTHVVVGIDGVEKGEIGGSSIRLMLETGLVGTKATGATTDLWNPYEPAYELGEEVLLFLHRGYENMQSDPDNPYRLDVGEYRPCRWEAFTVREGVYAIAIPDKPPATIPIEEALHDVRLTVRTQAAGCRPEGDR